MSVTGVLIETADAIDAALERLLYRFGLRLTGTPVTLMAPPIACAIGSNALKWLNGT